MSDGSKTAEWCRGMGLCLDGAVRLASPWGLLKAPVRRRRVPSPQEAAARLCPQALSPGHHPLLTLVLPGSPSAGLGFTWVPAASEDL